MAKFLPVNQYLFRAWFRVEKGIPFISVDWSTEMYFFRPLLAFLSETFLVLTSSCTVVFSHISKLVLLWILIYLPFVGLVGRKGGKTTTSHTFCLQAHPNTFFLKEKRRKTKKVESRITRYTETPTDGLLAVSVVAQDQKLLSPVESASVSLGRRPLDGRASCLTFGLSTRRGHHYVMLVHVPHCANFYDKHGPAESTKRLVNRALSVASIIFSLSLSLSVSLSLPLSLSLSLSLTHSLSLSVFLCFRQNFAPHAKMND